MSCRLFETCPSLILQIRILSVIGIDRKLGVSTEALILSIFFALLHIFMEGMIIKLDSSACHLSMYQYCIVCMNARLSWIPYANILTMKSIGKNNNSINTNEHINAKICKLSQFTSISFEQIVSKFLCLKYKLDFQFGKDSWQILIKYINNIVEFAPNSSSYSYNKKNINNINQAGDVELESIGVRQLLAPILTDTIDDGQLTNQERSVLIEQNDTFLAMPQIMKLTFGAQCCKNIDLFDLYRLYQVGSNKVILDCETINWENMIRRTRNLHSESQVINVLDDLNRIFLSVGDYGAAIELDKHRVTMGYSNYNYNSASNNDITLTGNDTPLSLLQERLRANNLFLSLKERLLENVRFNMFPLKKCYKNGVMYGMNCNESKKLYLIVYQLLQLPLESANTLDLMMSMPYASNSDDYDDYDDHDDHDATNYVSIFENGQYFYTAMLVLFFTQGTIFEGNHHCYQCGKDWTEHLQQFDNNFKDNFSDNDNDNNNNNENEIDSAPLSIRDRIGRLFAVFIPQEIEIRQRGSGVDTNTRCVPIEATIICSPLNKAFGEYLFKRAYFYSLAIGAVKSGVDSQILNDLLKQLNKNKSFVIKHNDNGKQFIDHDHDTTREQLDLLTQFGKAVTGTINIHSCSSGTGVLDDGFMNEINPSVETVKLIHFDKKENFEIKESSRENHVSFYGELQNRDNIFVAKINVGVSFDISVISLIFSNSNSVLNADIDIWDGISDDDIVCKAYCYLYCKNATKIPLDKPIDINASDIKNGMKIDLSWNINHIYNIQNNINIGTANIEIKFTFVDLLIQEFDTQDMGGNINMDKKLFDSIDCQAVYQDIATFDI